MVERTQMKTCHRLVGLANHRSANSKCTNMRFYLLQTALYVLCEINQTHTVFYFFFSGPKDAFWWESRSGSFRYFKEGAGGEPSQRQKQPAIRRLAHLPPFMRLVFHRKNSKDFLSHIIYMTNAYSKCLQISLVSCD